MKNNNKQINNIVILALSFGVFLLSVYALVGPQANFSGADSETKISLNSNEEITSKVKQIAPSYEECYDRGDGSTICCIPVGQKKNLSENTALCDHFEMLEAENGKLFIVRQTQ